MTWLIPIIDAVLGSVVRSALMMLTGYLIERHLVSQEIADTFVSEGVKHVLIAVPAVLAMAWSIWVKIRGRARFLTALEAPPGTTEDQVKEKVAAGLGVSVKAGAIALACLVAATSAACAGKRHPNLSPVGQAASYALDALTIAEQTSNALKAQVDSGAVKMSADIATALRGLGNIGAAAHDIGVLLDVYNQATDEAGRVQALTSLDAKIAELERFVNGLPRAAIDQAVTDLSGLVTKLKTTLARKG